MYRRPKFLEILHEVRQEMSRAADYDVDLFVEQLRSGNRKAKRRSQRLSLSDIEPDAINLQVHDISQH